MRVLVTGGDGQLGRDIVATAPPETELVPMNRLQLDITNAEAVELTIQKFKPDWVINTAAYTAVDLAESEVDKADQVNAIGPANVAASCNKIGCRLLHISTDYVFDGAANTPYLASQTPSPQSIYGKSKLDGEAAVLGEAGLSVSIVRVAWLYGAHGNNFLKTMLRLMSERSDLGVVVDQVGSPTWTRPLAIALWRMTQQEKLTGIWHWSDLGVASWFDFAQAIYQAGRKSGRLTHEVTIKPITTEQFPTPARRPAYSVLDSVDLRTALKLPGGYWRDHVFELIESGLDD